MKDGWIKVAAGTPQVRVADCAYNAEKTIDLVRQASGQGIKLLVLPELGLTGYTCADLFLQPTLLDGAQEALGRVLEATRELEVVFVAGLPVRTGGKLFNCAAVCQKGVILGLIPKEHVTAMERRYFAPAPAEQMTVSCCGQWPILSAKLLFRCREMPLCTVGVEVCQDLWVASPPSTDLAAAGATVVCNLSASSEAVGKAAYRRQLVSGQSARTFCAYLYASAGEGESTSDQIYTGHRILAEDGVILAEQRFRPGLCVTEIDVQRLEQERRRMNPFDGCPVGYQVVEFSWTVEETTLTRPVAAMPFVPQDEAQRRETCEEILTVTALGLKRRLEHTGAKTAVIGLSGGLDSTLALLITLRAFDLLERDHGGILAVTMPCFGTTDRTRSNAGILAQRSGCSFRTVPIGETVRSHFRDIGQSMETHDVTFENAQARERTQVLMDLANQTGGLVVGTGDLSELALGWATYNGDHMSMYGVNGAIPKTLVRRLVDHVARQTQDDALRGVLEDILDTPVSPELLPAVDGKIAQKTEDLVGPYELHDFFLYYLLRWSFPPGKVLRLAQYAWGGTYDKETILKWLRTFCRRFFAQQFKRNCLPDGPAVGSVGLSPRGAWLMPSDAVWALWQKELDEL